LVATGAQLGIDEFLHTRLPAGRRRHRRVRARGATDGGVSAHCGSGSPRSRHTRQPALRRLEGGSAKETSILETSTNHTAIAARTGPARPRRAPCRATCWKDSAT